MIIFKSGEYAVHYVGGIYTISRKLGQSVQPGPIVNGYNEVRDFLRGFVDAEGNPIEAVWSPEMPSYIPTLEWDEWEGRTNYFSARSGLVRGYAHIMYPDFIVRIYSPKHHTVKGKFKFPHDLARRALCLQ